MKMWKMKRYVVVPQEAADYVLRNIAFFGYLATLMVIYIFIVHKGEGRVREYQALRKEVKELRWQYHTLRSDLTLASMQSALSRDVAQFAGDRAGSIPQVIETH